MQALLKKAAGLDIAMICPLHGPVLKEDLGRHIGLYDTWSKYEPETEGVLVAYASIHGNTAAAARKMGEILQAKGATVALIDLTRDDMAKAVESAFRFSKMIVAASSYDAGVFPPMFDFLHHLQIKNFQKRRVGIIGLANNESALSSACDKTRFLDSVTALRRNLMALCTPRRNIFHRHEVPDLYAL